MATARPRRACQICDAGHVLSSFRVLGWSFAPALTPSCTLPCFLMLHPVSCHLQVKAGSIFDNIIVTDNFAAAKKFAEDTWSKLKEAEKKMFDSISEVSSSAV